MRTDKEEICRRMDEIHTTAMGYGRIRKNLGLCGADPVAHCKNIIMDSRCTIHRKGKNWYCEMDNVRITVNTHSCTIITAHILK